MASDSQLTSPDSWSEGWAARTGILPQWCFFLVCATFKIWRISSLNPSCPLPKQWPTSSIHSFIWCLVSAQIPSFSAFSETVLPALYPLPLHWLLPISFETQPRLPLFRQTSLDCALWLPPCLSLPFFLNQTSWKSYLHTGLHFFSLDSLTFPRSLLTRDTHDFAQTLCSRYAVWHFSSKHNWRLSPTNTAGVTLTFLAVPSLLHKEGLSFACSLNSTGLSEILYSLHSVYPRWSYSLQLRWPPLCCWVQYLQSRSLSGAPV